MTISLELFSYNFTIVLLGTMLLGVACGVVGLFTLLRRRSLIGDCVAHASLPGICLSFLIFHERDFFILFIGAIIAGLISAWLVSALCANTKIKEDAAIALVLSTSFGLGITLSKYIQFSSLSNKAGIETFIFGNASTMLRSDLVLIAGVSALSIAVIVLLFKELTALCFDKTFGTIQGLSPFLLDIVLMTVLCLCTACGLPAVGAVLIVALLVIPPATARLWTNNIPRMALLSALFGSLSALIGTVISSISPPSPSFSGLPTGPLIVITASLLFIVSLFFATPHGMLFKLRRRIQ